MTLEVLDLAAQSSPELMFGLVAPVGTPLKFFQNVLADSLRRRGHKVEVLRLSSYTSAAKLDTLPPPRDCDEYTRIRTLMRRGDELREKAQRGDVLALLAAGDINRKRGDPAGATRLGQATVLSQLKHPDEVYTLRQVYRGGFHLIGVYCPASVRKNDLELHVGMKDFEADELIRVDEYEASRWGQKLRDTFYLSDLFIEVKAEVQEAVVPQVERFLDLLFGQKVITPTADEYAMFLAQAAALRSSSLSRQVGAAILSAENELLAVGSNEVPCYGGGQYWEGSIQDHRDHKRGRDSSDQIRARIVEEIVRSQRPDWDTIGEDARMKLIDEASLQLEGTRVMSLTEFGRAVHAEMEAIIAAARIGTSIRGASLYTTTFPCHGCAKHIIGAGIKRVIYVEPYPKSLAVELHSDCITLKDEMTDQVDDDRRIIFAPFLGVAPRRYTELFSSATQEGIQVRRKDRLGYVQDMKPSLRISMIPYNYIERERIAAREGLKLFEEEGPNERS